MNEARNSLTRRELLKAGSAGLATLALPPLLQPARAQAGRRIPIGVQLYSVRADCAKDFDAALKQIAEMGFEGVEFAGYYQYRDDARGLRKRLDDLGLKAAGTHIGAQAFAPDNLKRTIEFHKEIGCRFLIVPGDRRFTDPERSKEYARLMNETAAALKPEGLFCGHHNHTREFQKEGEKTYWDLFAERTSPDVILQQDVAWTAAAGYDPVAYVRKYPGRTRTTHFKARTTRGAEGQRPIIGEDAIDWKSLIAACSEVGGTEWFIVEQEEYPEGLSPMECTKLSLQGLKKLLGR